MFAAIKRFFTKTPEGVAVEHYAVTFLAVFTLTGVATFEHAASTHGFQLSWSFVAAAAVTAARAGYDAVRPAIVAALSALIGKKG